MNRIFHFTILAAALIATGSTLQSCARNITIADIAGNYISNGNGSKITLNPDGTGSDVGITGDRFEMKYRIENNKILTQEYRDSSPNAITNITLAQEHDGNFCITEPQQPFKVCYIKQ